MTTYRAPAPRRVSGWMASGALLWLCFGAAADPRAGETARVAVWDAEKNAVHERFAVNADYLDRVAEWLRGAGLAVDRLDAAALADAERLAPGRYAAVVLEGRTVPRAALANLEAFAREGGVLVALNAGRVPFLIAVEPDPERGWRPSPAEPTFAWQTTQLLKAVGGEYRYDQSRENQGVLHDVTPRLARELPAGAEGFVHRMETSWIPPGKGHYWPLLRARRMDGSEAVPPIFVAGRDRARAVVCLSGALTGAPVPPGDHPAWPWGRETAVGLVRIALALHAGETAFDPADAVAPATAPQDILTQRWPRGEVAPEGARPVARFGRFDGSSLDLAPWPDPAPAGAFAGLPRKLPPGASARLAFPADGTPVQLRLRGAFASSGAALRVDVDGETYWHERFLYFDSGGQGNFQAADLKNVPNEFHRVVFLPPPAWTAAAGAGVVVVANTGEFPVYFDAAQVERVPTADAAPAWRIGMNAGAWGRRDDAPPVAPDTTRAWARLRHNPRPQLIGPPGDPDRWKAFDEKMRKPLLTGVPLELVLEGTPPWAPISEERLERGRQDKRPHVVPPDPDRYAVLVGEIARRYAGKVAAYEIWNEPNLWQFWRGSPEEFIALHRAVARAIRAADPGAEIISAGLAGWHASFASKLAGARVWDEVDLLAVHPYAGRSASWDKVYNQMEGELYAQGFDKPLYANESGFPWMNVEWFKVPPVFNPAAQAAHYDRAMARLVAGRAVMVSVFNAGGDGDQGPYGLFDHQSRPRPAYAAYADYFALNGGRRVELSLAGDAGASLAGVYAAASALPGGEIVLIANPSECARLLPVGDGREHPILARGMNAYGFFAGKTQWRASRFALEKTGDKDYYGYNVMTLLAPARYPVLEADAAETDGPWSLQLEADGKKIMLVENGEARRYRVDLAPHLGGRERVDAVFTLRIPGRTVFNALRALPDERRPAPPTAPERVVVRLPLSRGGAWHAVVRDAGGAESGPVAVAAHERHGHAWAELPLDLRTRTVVRLRPGPAAPRAAAR